MDLIAQNPYRVLGMFANDSLKVMTANIARIRAYNRVGKQINFASDHDDIFGKVNRNEAAIQLAITRLSDKIEAKTWQLFWIHSTSENKNLIDVQTPSVQGDITNAVLELNDYQTHKQAAQYWAMVFEREINETNLFEGYSFWENEGEKADVAKCFLDKLIPDCSSDNLSFRHETSEGWFWWLRDNLSKNNSLRQALEIKYKSFAFDFIKEIIDCCITVDPVDQKYRKLLWLAKPYLRILDIFTAHDDERRSFKCPKDIQIVKDNFANFLIKFSEEVYHNTLYWEASQLSDMIDFINIDVRKLVFSSSTHDVLEEKLRALRDQIPFLAPEQCKDDAKRIHGLIQAFCGKKDSVKWSLWLIRQCVTPLLNIRDALGNENVYYRHISTKIADNAIYSADVDLCCAERMLGNPANDKQIAETHLQYTLLQCRLLICDIELYDLKENFLEGKFTTYKNMVTRIAKKYNCVEEIVPDISMISEVDEFTECGDDYGKLCDFVQKYPNGKFCSHALSKIHNIEDAFWPKTLSVENLFEYKRQFPNSHNEYKIIDALDKLLLKAKLSGVIDDAISQCFTMLQLFSNHPRRLPEIRDRIEFLIYQRCENIQDCQEYLDTYPNGKYVHQVKDKVKAIKKDEILQIFIKCQTIADYNRFILLYPTSELCVKASQRIEDLFWEDVQFSEDFESYISRYPQGRYILEAHKFLSDKQAKAREIEENNRFKACKTIADFKSYNKAYPDGKYFLIAKAIIRKHNRKIWLFMILSILSILAIIGCVFASYFSQTVIDSSKISQMADYQHKLPATDGNSNLDLSNGIPETLEFEKKKTDNEGTNNKLTYGSGAIKMTTKYEGDYSSNQICSYSMCPEKMATFILNHPTIMKLSIEIAWKRNITKRIDKLML